MPSNKTQLDDNDIGLIAGVAAFLVFSILVGCYYMKKRKVRVAAELEATAKSESNDKRSREGGGGGGGSSSGNGGGGSGGGGGAGGRKKGYAQRLEAMHRDDVGAGKEAAAPKRQAPLKQSDSEYIAAVKMQAVARGHKARVEYKSRKLGKTTV